MARRPTVELPAGRHGERQQSRELQEVGGGIGVPQRPDARHVAAVNAPVGPEGTGAFGPTERPGEPLTAGIPLGAGPGPLVGEVDPNLLLQAMWSVLPHPSIARLLYSEHQDGV